MKPIEITDDFYVESNEDFNKKNPKFKVGDHIRIFSIFFTFYAISLHLIILKLIVNLFFVLKILIY